MKRVHRIAAGVPANTAGAAPTGASRVPRGTPTGGQFSVSAHAESGVALTPETYVADTVDPGPPPGTGWNRRVSEYTGLVSYERDFPVPDGTATHIVSGTVPGEEPQVDGDAVDLGSGGISISQGDKVPGQIHYKVLDAPLLDVEGQPTGERAKVVYINWVEVARGTMPNKGKGWASAMYAAIRAAHPDVIIPAAANLEAPGKRVVKHYRDKHPETHTGRFDTDNRVHPTSGPNDPTYRAAMLTGPSWDD